MLREENGDNKSLITKRYNDRRKSNKYSGIIIFYFYVLAAFVMSTILPHEYIWTSLFYSAVIIGAVFFAALAEKSKTPLLFNFFYSLSFLLLYFILGFRDLSGLDDPSYLRIFNEVSEYGWISRFAETTMEPGYLLLNSMVSFFTDNYLYMQLITSFIPLALFYYGFKKYKSMISLPMAVFLLCATIYFQVLAVAIVRMFIALSIVFIAIYHIPHKNTKKYILLILVASLFHYSAIFMLVLSYFAINRDDFSKKAKRFVPMGFLLIPFFFIAASNYLVPLLGARYSVYGQVGDLSFSIFDLSTIPLLIFLLLYYKRIEKDKLAYFIFSIAVLALTSILSFYSSMVSFGRLIFYSNSALFFAAPMIDNALKKSSSSRRVFFYVIIIVYGFLYVYRTQFSLEPHIPSLFPYKNVFFEI